MRYLLLSVLLLTALLAQAQLTEEDQKRQIIEQRIELIAENLEAEDIDFTTLFDAFDYYFDHPINLNQAEYEDLKELHLLSDVQINALLDHIQRTGKLISFYELQGVNGFDLSTIRLIQPFIYVTDRFEQPRITFNDLVEQGKHVLFLRYIRILEEQEGYSAIEDSVLAENPNRRYLGSPNRLYTRYRYQFGNKISVGFTAEKDAGEEFFTGTQNQGFDYYSGHLYLRDFGHLHRLAVGDYQLQFGQGLTLWSGLGFGKSADVLNVKRNGSGIRPYTSVDENRFMRGAASTWKFGKVEATAFYSSKGIDANIIESDTADGEPGELTVSSFQTSGLHRTPNEITDKDAITERHYGGRLAWKARTVRIGLTALRTEYEGQVTRDLALYNQFDFNSNRNLVTGADFDWVYRNFNFFGEAARSETGGLGYSAGVLAALDPRLSLTFLFRNFDTDFQSQLSNGISESSRNQNERGYYMGFVARPFKRTTLSVYYDQFRFPWMRFRVNAPSTGSEYLVQLDYRLSRRLSFYVRYREENKDRNSRDDVQDIVVPRLQDRQSLRGQVNVQITSEIELKSRVELSRYRLEGASTETGYLAFQDINYRPKNKPYSFSFRYALFDTDSYDTRIYAYENDILYFFSIPAYYNRGNRIYLTTKFRVNRKVDLWLRWAQFYYTNLDEIGTALETIDGNTRSEIKAQLRLRL